MAVILPETVYDSSVNYHWMNENDRVAYQRSFEQSMPVGQRIAQAMIVANPATPNDEIRENMTAGAPDKWGVTTSPLTVTQILNNEFAMGDSRIDDSAWNDFSGTTGGYEATQRPSGTMW